jgi:hypothetical protein
MSAPLMHSSANSGEDFYNTSSGIGNQIGSGGGGGAEDDSDEHPHRRKTFV